MSNRFLLKDTDQERPKKLDNLFRWGTYHGNPSIYPKDIVADMVTALAQLQKEAVSRSCQFPYWRHIF